MKVKFKYIKYAPYLRQHNFIRYWTMDRTTNRPVWMKARELWTDKEFYHFVNNTFGYWF